MAMFDVPDKIATIVGSLPFMLYIKGKGPHVNSIRIIEVVLSSALTIGVLYGVMSADVKALKEGLMDLKQEIIAIRRDLYEPRSSDRIHRVP
jgi:hypothetical protein